MDLHHRPWISLWIKSISNELDIIIHVIASQLSRYCDVISNQLWRHQQNDDRASQTRGRCVKIGALSSFMDPLCRVRNKIMHVLSWRTVSVLTRVFFLYLLLSNSGNKHKNNLLVSAETVRHSSAYIILYISIISEMGPRSHHDNPLKPTKKWQSGSHIMWHSKDHSKLTSSESKSTKFLPK